MTDLLEIQKILQTKANEKVKASFKKFIPSSEKVYGVKVPELNNLIIRYKNGGFELVEKLWESGAFEEKLLATKILGKICKKDSSKSIELIKKFSKEISDWATCDTLAMQGIREIAKREQKEIFKISKNLINSKNFWERRFALVLLINFKKDKNFKKEINEILNKIKDDKENYVKKAIIWLKKELSK